MKTSVVSVETSHDRFTDVTAMVASFCREADSGLCHLFLPHATAGLALMELGSGSEGDLSGVLDRLLPRDDRYAHRHGSPGHGADHLLPVLVSPSLTLPVEGGQPLLGTWQSVVLVDLNPDNPQRSLRMTFVPA